MITSPIPFLAGLLARFIAFISCFGNSWPECSGQYSDPAILCHSLL